MRYTWDGENRLTGVESLAPTDGTYKKLDFAYDYMGRRVQKQVFGRNTGNTAWLTTPESDQRFVYDGWNVVETLTPNPEPPHDLMVVRKYTWGLDLSGLQGAAQGAAGFSPAGMQGAGGIGGLLAMYQPTTTPDLDSRNYWFLYDGNVTDVLDATAPWWGPPYPETHYEYDPYGNTTTATLDPYISPFRFSTKWFDTETDLYYYGHRYYSPRLGRWMSRDPIEESGGLNLYQYAYSNPVTYLDSFGLWGEDVHYGMTRELAAKAKFACADDVAKGCRQPDIDYRRPGPDGVLDILKWNLALPGLGTAKVGAIAEWHFPADADGWVRPNSYAAKAKVSMGIARCDFTLFSEGLHVLQDSWSHQGKPYIAGIGHYRGVRKRDFQVWKPPNTAGGMYLHVWATEYQDVSGSADAALHSTTDDVTLFPRDAREAGLQTYVQMLRFKKRCPCRCPQTSSSHGTGSVYSATAVQGEEAEDRAKVIGWLAGQFPGDNKIEINLYPGRAR